MSKSSNQENIPKLPERLNNSDVFCTHFILNTESYHQFFQWKNDNRLKRNFELYKKNNEVFAQFCSQSNDIINILEFWKNLVIDASPTVQQWERPDRRQLALGHVRSYLETSCYYAAREVCSKSKIRSWDDYLSSARIFIHNSDKIVKLLKSYDSSQASLKTYIDNILIKEIKNQEDICKYSSWRLVVEKSEIKLREALERYGIPEAKISQYIFGRKCFEPVYKFNKVQNPMLRRSGDKWLDPDSEDFQAAAESYNAEKFLSSAPHEVSAGSNISGEQMQAWMNTCIDALRKYENPTIDSSEDIDKRSKKNKPQDNDGCLDDSDSEDISLGAEESDSEANPRFEETKSAFYKELDRLRLDQHQILLLYYGAGLNQKQIEIQLQVSQSAISRRLNTINKKLLNTLIQKSQPDRWVRSYVVEWLHKSFQSPQNSELLEATLVEAVQELDYSERQVLFLRYGDEQVNEQNIANQIGISLLEVNAIIDTSQYKLEAYLIKELPHWEKQYVEEWLKEFYKSKVLVVCENLNLSLEGEDTSQIIDRIVEEYLQSLIVTEIGE
ncbi:sigma-70 family RNA polymerase sigma factor [Microcoleus sp.]|uniref:sigma-70 family RNA polymerase sigma factor n=1 Tax=Microcoleus sp. TaxID=44472 RepID=UPI0035259D67